MVEASETSVRLSDSGIDVGRFLREFVAETIEICDLMPNKIRESQPAYKVGGSVQNIESKIELTSLSGG